MWVRVCEVCFAPFSALAEVRTLLHTYGPPHRHSRTTHATNPHTQARLTHTRTLHAQILVNTHIQQRCSIRDTRHAEAIFGFPVALKPVTREQRAKTTRHLNGKRQFACFVGRLNLDMNCPHSFLRTLHTLAHMSAFTVARVHTHTHTHTHPVAHTLHAQSCTLRHTHTHTHTHTQRPPPQRHT